MYIYLGGYFHRHGTDMSNIVERKIGKTNNLNRREYELNDTKMTIGYTIIQAWKTGDRTDDIEKAIHALLDHDRMSGEWFNDRDGSLGARLSKFMKYSNVEEYIFEEDDDVVVNQTRRLARSKSQDSLIKEWFKDSKKWSQYFANKKFKLVRPNGFEQVISIQPDDTIHCDTEDTTIKISDKNYTPNYAFELGMRNKWIKEGINPEGKLSWYSDEWKRLAKEQNLWKPFNNGWDTVDLETGKTLMELATEIYNRETGNGTEI